MLVLLNGFMKCAVELGSGGVIYLPSFMKIGKGIQTILWFGLSNLKGCIIGTTDGRDL
jgi:hypothetical protein